MITEKKYSFPFRQFLEERKNLSRIAGVPENPFFKDMTSPFTLALWLDVHSCNQIRFASEHVWGDSRQWQIGAKSVVAKFSYTL
ncbi:MAG: hypothetical protein SH820_17710 [Xanthomonadales bacterium]|nr:hypothetical protein [Xanthomonadales bacterium]